MEKKKRWKDLSKSKKVSIIVSIVIWAILIAFIVLVIFSKDIFGTDSPFSGILGTTDEAFDLGKWFSENWTKFAASIFYIALFIGASWLIRFILSHIFTKNKKATTIIKLINSFIKYIAVIVMIFVVLGVWGVSTGTLLASAGILALIVGLGAQPLISDIIAGLFIVFDDDYQVGDIIVVDDFRGTVKEIGIRNTKILDAGGNIKIVNNSKIASIVNMSADLSLAIIDISIDYDQDIPTAEKVITDAFPILKAKFPAIVGNPEYLGVQEWADSSLNLRVICHCKEENKFQLTRDLNREYWIICMKNNIDIPYDQLVISQRGVNDD